MHPLLRPPIHPPFIPPPPHSRIGLGPTKHVLCDCNPSSLVFFTPSVLNLPLSLPLFLLNMVSTLPLLASPSTALVPGFIFMPITNLTVPPVLCNFQGCVDRSRGSHVPDRISDHQTCTEVTSQRVARPADCYNPRFRLCKSWFLPSDNKLLTNYPRGLSSLP